MDNLTENRIVALERVVQHLCKQINSKLQLELKKEITDRTPGTACDVLIKWKKGSNQGYFVGFYGKPIGRDCQEPSRWYIKIGEIDSIRMPEECLVISWSLLPDNN